MICWHKAARYLAARIMHDSEMVCVRRMQIESRRRCLAFGNERASERERERKEKKEFECCPMALSRRRGIFVLLSLLYVCIHGILSLVAVHLVACAGRLLFSARSIQLAQSNFLPGDLSSI